MIIRYNETSNVRIIGAILKYFWNQQEYSIFVWLKKCPMQLNVQALSAVILNQFPDVAFAYLFGSSQEGTVKDGSDVDIAMYYTGNDTFVRLRVEETLEKTFPQLVFDIVELQKASPLLAFDALRGTLLFVRPEAMELYVGFYTRTCRLREDRMYWMKKQLTYRGYDVQWSD